MKPKTDRSPESVVREIRRKTRRKFNPSDHKSKLSKKLILAAL